ncbi:MAG TPA: hypothetical protein VFX60_00490 [Micromonospora sp.]|nr:hypothetical protein [Micromonospora sp.]
MATENQGVVGPSPEPVTGAGEAPPPPQATVAVTGASGADAADRLPNGDDEPPEPVPPGPLARRWRSLRARWQRNPRAQDLAAVASFVALGFWVTFRLWRDLSHGLSANKMDHAQFEWMLAHGARVITKLVYPFVSYQMNVPDGVNMMANTSVLAISLPLSPITLLFGPHVSFNVFLTAALVATAVSWYFLLSRYLVTSRLAAWIGATFCAFAPSMISHANGHPNIVSQFVLPLIIWRVLRLREPGRWLRNGLILGLLIIWQAFINLELLLLTAVGIGIFVTVATIVRPEYRRYVKPYAAGLGVAGVVALAVLAYPLYVQFFGPQAYHGLPGYIRAYGADLGSFVAFARESIGGSARTAKGLAQNPTEENAFFGWPLAILVLALVWWLRRSVAVLGLAAVGLVFALFSLGPTISFNGQDTGIPSLWRLMVNVPVLNAVVPTRWALAIAPVVGLLLAFGCERAAELARRHPQARGPIRFATATVLAMALIPVAPTPLPTKPLTPAPEFITSGTWRQYAAGDRSVVTLPLPGGTYPDPIRWSAQTRHEMRIPHGYFLGPEKDPKKPGNRTARFSPPWRPTVTFVDDIMRTGRVPKVTAKRRAETVEDLRYWRAGVVILAPGKRDAALRRGMTELTGVEPTFTGGVWVWDVRPLVD